MKKILCSSCLLDEVERELNYARNNADKCLDEHSEEYRENTGELEHADGHVDNALGYLQTLKELVKVRKIFKVAEEEKCGGCNWEVRNLYLMAENEEEARELYRENDRGLCADCLVELIMDEDLELPYPKEGKIT